MDAESRARHARPSKIMTYDDMRHWLARVLAVAGLAAPFFSGGTPVAAQQARLPVLEPSVPLQESYQKDFSAASGGLVHGVLLGPLDGQVNLADLRVALPAAGLGPSKLCVIVQSIDGRYSGEVAYAFPRAAQEARLKFPTQFESQLRQYRARELAVLAHLAPDCAQRARSILMTSWGPAPNGPPTLFVNALGGDAQILSGKHQFPCSESPGESFRAFHLECGLPAGLHGPTQVTVAVYRYDELEKQETFMVHRTGR